MEIKKTASTSKIFIIDTNIILHNYNAIYNFQENDIIIPINVLEELDSYKTGNELKNYHAREFMRILDRLFQNNEISEGAKLGENLGKLYIVTGNKYPKVMQESFNLITQDHNILSIAYHYKTTHTNSKVVLLSQDINMRMKAKAIGLDAQDYNTGKVADIDKINETIKIFENISDENFNLIVQNMQTNLSDLQIDSKELYPNSFFIAKKGDRELLCRYNAQNKSIIRINKKNTYGIKPRNSEQTFAFDALLNKDINLVALTGKAGTGKTLLALAAALEQRADYLQIYLARPIVALSNKDLGFLPGSPKEKIKPFMQPLFDNLNVIKKSVGPHSKDGAKIDQMLEKEELIIEPLAYIRGRSLANVFFIVDEAHNLTRHEIKTIITRAGDGAKIIFTGDIQQIDTPYLDEKSNGLSYLTDKMKGQNLFAHINLIKGERSELAELASEIL